MLEAFAQILSTENICQYNRLLLISFIHDQNHAKQDRRILEALRFGQKFHKRDIALGKDMDNSQTQTICPVFF